MCMDVCFACVRVCMCVFQDVCFVCVCVCVYRFGLVENLKLQPASDVLCVYGCVFGVCTWVLSECVLCVCIIVCVYACVS